MDVQEKDSRQACQGKGLDDDKDSYKCKTEQGHSEAADQVSE